MKINLLINFFYNFLLIFFISNCYFFSNEIKNKQTEIDYYKEYVKLKPNKALFIKEDHIKFIFIGTSEYVKLLPESRELFKMIPYKISPLIYRDLLYINIIYRIFSMIINYLILLKSKELRDSILYGIFFFMFECVFLLFFYKFGLGIFGKYKKNKSMTFYHVSYKMDDDVLFINFASTTYFCSYLFCFVFLEKINQNITAAKRSLKDHLKLILFCFISFFVLPVIIFQIFAYFFFELNFYYQYNTKLGLIYFNNYQLEKVIKLMPYLIKSNKTIFDLADDDPEALKILNS